MDRKKFYSKYRIHFGRLNQTQVEGLELLLDVSLQYNVTINHLAYILATVYHETNKTFQPVREGYWLPLIVFKKWAEKKYGYQTKVGKQLGHTKPGDGAKYYGRGYVQLTGKRNYELFSFRVNEELVGNPDKVMEPKLAAYILFEGMIYGLYTGKGLSDYINPLSIDFVNARRIVNGMDKAKKIAGYAEKFKRCLEE